MWQQRCLSISFWCQGPWGVRGQLNIVENCESVVTKKRFRETFVFTGSSETAGWFPQILLCYLNFESDSQFFLLFYYQYIFVFLFSFPHFLFSCPREPLRGPVEPLEPCTVYFCLVLYLVPIVDSVSMFPLFLLQASNCTFCFNQSASCTSRFCFFNGFAGTVFNYSVFFATSRVCLLPVFTVFAYSQSPTFQLQHNLSYKRSCWKNRGECRL